MPISRTASKTATKTKSKKKKQSQEEAERLAREEEERKRLEQLHLQEVEAEDFQRYENEQRDAAELREKKRLKREYFAKLMAEKDSRIVSLSNQINALQASFNADRIELEEELRRQRQLTSTLDNALSEHRTEADEVQRALLAERDSYAGKVSGLEAELRTLTNSSNAEREEFETRQREITEVNARLTLQCEKAEKDKEMHERDMSHRIHSLERELEKVSSINVTLQDVIEAREADDRKNVTLMQLLNNQLDENKRRSQELLEEEQLRLTKLQREHADLEGNYKQLKEEKQIVEQELGLSRDIHEREVADFKSKIGQLKFDEKYLSAELQQYKKDLGAFQQEASVAKQEAQSKFQETQLGSEANAKKCSELEALLRRKDREHFDKITFLNAQISNNRTIIAQLQQRLNKEREEHMNEISAATSDIQKKASVVQAMHDDLQRKKVASSEVEMTLNSDIAVLKTTVFQLQSALVERERELFSLTAAKDEELRSLRLKLDENFIPHRKPDSDNISAVGTVKTAADGEEGDYTKVDSVQQSRLAAIQRQLEVTTKNSLEAETRFKAQIANQNHIIDTLQSDILIEKETAAKALAEQRNENKKLCHLLDTHQITYR